MLEPLVVAYVGDENQAIDVVRALDRRINRPVHLLGTDDVGVSEILADSMVDGVVCGPIGSNTTQSVVDAAVAEDNSPPIFTLRESDASVPASVEFHSLGDHGSQEEAIDDLVGKLLEQSGRADERAPRSLGQYLSIDDSWTITDWDPRLETWTNCSPAEAVGSDVWQLFPACEYSELADLCRTVRADGSPETRSLYHEPADRWFDTRVIPLESGGIECFLRDVSEHRQAGSLEGPTARFEDMLERITDAFFALDNEDRFVLLNSHAEEVLDVDAAEVTGVRFWDAFPAAMSSSFYSEFNDAMSDQEPTSFEEHYRPQDRWFEVNAYPSAEGLSVFLRDITEQKELQEKLQALHDVTRELIVAESDSEIAEGTVAAAEEILDFPLVAVWRHNDATKHLDPLAWSPTIGDRYGSMEPLGPESEFIWEVYETGESRHLGFVPATTSTSHHPGKVTSELLVPVGDYGVLGGYSTERDAFDEADVELFRLLASTVESAFARTRRERQLAQRNERLNDFASVVSHDLRNPLNIAAAHAELARDVQEPDPHLDKIDESLERMESLIEDLLARARGDQDLDREPLSLAAVARDAWAGVKTADADLTIQGEATLDADADRLRQLFENLFRNSVEHAGETVSIRIGTGTNSFFVADDGPGIPPDEREDIFEQGVTHSDEGTGYGLAIVADIVEGHGWSIEVDESDDGGAEFTISDVRSLTDGSESA